jgi:hypothetical protein
MSVEAYNIVLDAWKRVKPYIRDVLRGEFGKYVRTPGLVVVNDIPYSKDGKRVIAYYDKRRNEIVVSAKYIDELRNKYDEKDLECAIVHVIFHELKHFIDCKKHGRCNDEEEAESFGLEHRILCYADLIKL